MICLDTNYLIRGLITGTEEASRIYKWLEEDRAIHLASVTWYEFLCGSVTGEELELADHILTGGILPFEILQAEIASKLFNGAGRKRALRVDSMIAATAIEAGAHLATNNLGDFELFVPHGLALV